MCMCMCKFIWEELTETVPAVTRPSTLCGRSLKLDAAAIENSDAWLRIASAAQYMAHIPDEQAVSTVMPAHREKGAEREASVS